MQPIAPATPLDANYNIIIQQAFGTLEAMKIRTIGSRTYCVSIDNRKGSMISDMYIHPYRSVTYTRTPCVYVTLLMVVVSTVCAEAKTNRNLVTVFGRLFPTRKFKMELVQTSSFSSTNDPITVATIDDGATIMQSSVSFVNDMHVTLETMSLFMRGVNLQYNFRSASDSTESMSSYDTSYPYTLSAGSSNDMSTLQDVGLHELTVTMKGWFGIRIGSPQTMVWNIVDDAAFTKSPSGSPSGLQNVVGDLQLWHKVTIVFNNGPSSSESATPNPFTDYRLDVKFRNSNTGTLMTVPGYYAADGNAQQTSATTGRVWHCHFAPAEIGSWTWQASFRTGLNIAMAAPGNVLGSTVSPIHGASGSFLIQPSNKTGIDLRGKGLLRHVKGKHHLQFAGSGEWFLKAGTDSPENFLAYNDFDNTPDNGQLRKSWSSHVIDFVSGDPTWANGKGKGIIGAINYLSGQGMRAFSFLTMNIDGDDRNVYPYVDPSDRLRFDVSKLAQWEVVFEHGTRKGMFLHFKTQERENDQLLDQGDLGNERKLYYRELIARFGHNLALNWNIGEENTNTVEQQKQFADWFKLLDPYQHPVVIHTWPTEQALVYGPLYGHASYDGASLQTDAQDVFQDTLARIQDSVAAGNPWVVSNDEQGSANAGVVPDSADFNHDSIRRDVLWGNIMVRYIYTTVHDTQRCLVTDFPHTLIFNDFELKHVGGRCRC